MYVSGHAANYFARSKQHAQLVPSARNHLYTGAGTRRGHRQQFRYFSNGDDDLHAHRDRPCGNHFQLHDSRGESAYLRLWQRTKLGLHVELDINCNNGTYTIVVTPAILANWTQNGTTSLATTVGNVNIIDHPLPTVFGTISGSGNIPAHGLLYSGSSTDFYRSGGLGENMFLFGTVSESSGGTASASWTLAPTP